MITKFRLWLARKILGLPEKYCKNEADRLYAKIWPKHYDTKDATIRAISLFMMRQRINERLEHCRRKRYHMW